MALPSQLGHFKLLEEIAHGGMGTVIRAFDPTLNREVAIKVLREDLASDPKFLEDFQREARIVASISHPHIVQIYFVGEEAGQYYLVMELLKGRTLREVVEEKGPLDEESALDLMIDVAEALRAAYRSQMIHGDIKPANIFITEDFGAKVLDFGLAKLANMDVDPTGGIWGSPYYMSPERVGQKAEDFRSDIYSLGATLFDALTARPPFDAENLEDLALKRLNEKPPLLREINPKITAKTEGVVDKMLSKSTLMRYRDYDHLLQDLREAKTEATAQRLGVQLHVDHIPAAPEPPPPPPPPPQIAWKPMILTGVVGLVIVALAALLWYEYNVFISNSRKPKPPQIIQQPHIVPKPPPVVVRTNPPPQSQIVFSKDPLCPCAEEIANARRTRTELVEQESQLIQTNYASLTPSWQNYDFTNMVASWQTLEPQITTTTNRVMLAYHLWVATLLADFKLQLINDISRFPYSTGDLATRQGVRLPGRLFKATQTELTFRIQLGPEIFSEATYAWGEMTAPTLRRLAFFYAAAYDPYETNTVQARRYLLICAFAKEYNLMDSQGVAADKVLELDPSLRPELLRLFNGRIPRVPPPPARPPPRRGDQPNRDGTPGPRRSGRN